MEGSAWLETAWNGMVLGHPATWEVARLYRDQLLWSDGQSAALEIRWAQHKGRFVPERQFKRFVRHSRRKGLPTPESWTVPEAWRLALARFQVSGFKWRRHAETGHGLLVYCPDCRRLNLIQIHPALADQQHLIPTLLGAFRDHPDGNELTLNVFGVCARLPHGSQLVRFGLNTGHYHLLWRKHRLQIGLFRWAPAGAILERQSLADFAGNHFQPSARRRPGTGLAPKVHKGCEAVGGLWGRMLDSRSLSAWLERRLVRVWHDTDHNCLLGVEARGRGRGTNQVFERICDQFEAYTA